MPRLFVINGPALVKVRGANTLSDSELGDTPKTWQLGLAKEAVQVQLRPRHRDVNVDDFGPNVPPEVQWMLADALIRMVLIHYDTDALERCVIEGMAGVTEGVMAAAGTPMGGGVDLLTKGNRYVRLSVTSRNDLPFRFHACYLAGNPLDIPLGTEARAVVLNWRAIPYVCPIAAAEGLEVGSDEEAILEAIAEDELRSRGSVLWDREEEVD